MELDEGMAARDGVPAADDEPLSCGVMRGVEI